MFESFTLVDWIRCLAGFEIACFLYGILSSRTFFLGGWQYRSEPSDHYWTAMFTHIVFGLGLFAVSFAGPVS